MSFEKEYYENPVFWDIKRYFENQAELERFNKIISTIPSNVKSLLDVGCGNGVFLYLLKNKRSEISSVGLERSKMAIEIASKNFDVEIIEGNISSLPFRDASFDCLTALEVIEHLPYEIYERVLGEFERVAKKYIIISVPYEERRGLIQCPYCGCRFNPTFHLRRFNRKVLDNLFSNFKLTGFELICPEYEVYFHKVFSALYQLIFKPSFPENVICPACGYRKVNSSSSEDGSFKNIAKDKVKNILSRFVPRRKKYRWAVCIYERGGQTPGYAGTKT